MKINFVVTAEALNEFAIEPVSDAELYLELGRAVRACLERGLTLSLIAQRAQMAVEECLLALKYIESSTGFKLEALVEEWPWSRITAELARMEVEEEEARSKLASI